MCNIMAYVKNSSPFLSRLITSNFSSIPIVFHRIFTWITAGDVELCFSLKFLRKAKAVDEEITQAATLYHERNQSIHMTDGVTVMSLSAILLQRISAAMNHLCQFAVNQELSCIFEKWCIFSSHIKEKSHKKETAKK